MRAYLWLIRYEIGLIRRGLLGTLLTPIRTAFTTIDLYFQTVSVFYHTIMPLTLFAIFGWAAMNVFASKDRNVKVIGTAALVLLAASPMISNLAYNSGWLDGFLMAIGAICFAVVRRGNYMSAAVIAFVGVFVHEASRFCWL